jgi:hypothetical protein
MQHARGVDFDVLREKFLNLILLGRLDVRQFVGLLDNDCFQIYNDEIERKVPFYKDWKVKHDCDGWLGIYGVSYVSIFGKTIILTELEETKLSIVNNNRRDLHLNDLYTDSKIIAFHYYRKLKGFKYYLSSVIPDENMAIRTAETLKRQNKGFIIYLGQDDFDIKRKFR